MTLEEAKKVAEICSKADGGCGNCVRNLCEALEESFHEFEWSFSDENYDIKITVKERGGS